MQMTIIIIIIISLANPRRALHLISEFANNSQGEDTDLHQFLLFRLIIHDFWPTACAIEFAIGLLCTYLIISLLVFARSFFVGILWLPFAMPRMSLSVLPEKNILQTRNNDTFPYWESWRWSRLKCNYSLYGHTLTIYIPDLVCFYKCVKTKSFLVTK